MCIGNCRYMHGGELDLYIKGIFIKKYSYKWGTYNMLALYMNWICMWTISIIYIYLF